MVKLFQPFCIFLILLAFISGKTLPVLVNGAQCEEDMGPCDDRCNSKHSNGKRCSCDMSSTVARCKCMYDCDDLSPPKQKRCNAGIGPCSAACNDLCCDQNCAAKFKGHQDGHGNCSRPGPLVYNQCICYFNC
ncbi:defensin-like protein 182 [Herrania umbratica]|uniref:Defensin-like protein n=1 Tax=Herrania umbratica TaxID=108875 RepID=A0A6J0ZSW9_9ROSI|nr:defensin-like protein 182 [Herrania umbratica]